MAEGHETAQRKLARSKMREAMALFEGRHPERGVEIMQEIRTELAGENHG